VSLPPNPARHHAGSARNRLARRGYEKQSPWRRVRSTSQCPPCPRPWIWPAALAARPRLSYNRPPSQASPSCLSLSRPCLAFTLCGGRSVVRLLSFPSSVRSFLRTRVSCLHLLSTTTPLNLLLLLTVWHHLFSIRLLDFRLPRSPASSFPLDDSPRQLQLSLPNNHPPC
jgi:hypothetical protein